MLRAKVALGLHRMTYERKDMLAMSACVLVTGESIVKPVSLRQVRANVFDFTGFEEMPYLSPGQPLVGVAERIGNRRHDALRKCLTFVLTHIPIFCPSSVNRRWNGRIGPVHVAKDV